MYNGLRYGCIISWEHFNINVWTTDHCSTVNKNYTPAGNAKLVAGASKILPGSGN